MLRQRSNVRGVYEVTIEVQSGIGAVCVWYNKHGVVCKTSLRKVFPSEGRLSVALSP